MQMESRVLFSRLIVMTGAGEWGGEERERREEGER